MRRIDVKPSAVRLSDIRNFIKMVYGHCAGIASLRDHRDTLPAVLMRLSKRPSEPLDGHREILINVDRITLSLRVPPTRPEAR